MDLKKKLLSIGNISINYGHIIIKETVPRTVLRIMTLVAESKLQDITYKITVSRHQLQD